MDELNQCDGCRRGLPMVNGHHRGPTAWDIISCTADRYRRPPMDDLPEDKSIEYKEGWQAAADRKHFARDCPYSFARFGGSVRDFEYAGWRQKLNDWFNGWQAGLKENGLEVGKGFAVHKVGEKRTK